MTFPEPHPLDEQAAIQRVLSLMALAGRSREEAGVIAWIQQELAAAGIPASCMEIDRAAQRIPGGGSTGNLIVRLPGTRRGPRRLLMAHVDTVPICVGCDPVREGDRIRSGNPATGLGGDDRAGVAVILTAALELLRSQRSHPPLTLLFAVQEEIGLYGARYVSVSRLGNPRLCFNWDGGDPASVCLGATGDYAIDIEIEGLASHAGVHPERGVSAIAIAAAAITDLTQNGWHGLIRKGRNQGTSNVGIISGGEATNVVTPHVRLCAEARSHDPVFRQRIVEAYRKAFTRAARNSRSADGARGKVTFTAELKYESFRLEQTEPAVVAAAEAIARAGLAPEYRIGNGGLDANWMVAHGFPTVTLGCGQNEIHTTSEWLNVPDFLAACRIATDLAAGTVEQD